MRQFRLQRRTLAVFAVILPLVGLLVYVALRSGPLAPVAVTTTSVESRSISPALYGIGTVEARYSYKIGPTTAGRLRHLAVHVGDPVKAGQVIGEMDPVDLDDRVRAQGAAVSRADAAVLEAMARHAYAASQARRYEQLFGKRMVSEEAVTAKRQELQVADAGLAAAREERARAGSDRNAQRAQRRNLQLISPVNGIVVLRELDPGTTVVAGQPVVEIIDPASVWINVRFDQISASGLAASLPARIVLRSRSGEALPGRVYRIEPMADAVTEETMAKVVFEHVPSPLPPIGEIAEVTVDLPAVPAAPVLPNAAIQRQGDQVGVWQIAEDGVQFAPIQLGRADLDGYVQAKAGIEAGSRIVVYSEKTLSPKSRIRVVERIPGTPR